MPRLLWGPLAAESGDRDLLTFGRGYGGLLVVLGVGQVRLGEAVRGPDLLHHGGGCVHVRRGRFLLMGEGLEIRACHRFPFLPEYFSFYLGLVLEGGSLGADQGWTVQWAVRDPIVTLTLTLTSDLDPGDRGQVCETPLGAIYWGLGW